jgi:hypothetical protein
MSAGQTVPQMLIYKQDTCKRPLKFSNRWLLKDLRGVAEEDKTRVEEPRWLRTLSPCLGMPVKTVRRNDVECFIHGVAAGKAATRKKPSHSVSRSYAAVVVSSERTVALLGVIFSYAMRQGIGFSNPVHGVVRFAEARRDSDDCDRRRSGSQPSPPHS